jgi:serine/threonine-protein kinase
MSYDALRAGLADRYTIERELGHGGMATVYLALDLRHHRKVAIKVLRDDIGAAIGGRRFSREIEIAAGLSHPNILPMHDSGAVGDTLYYVMPYVAGESLRQKLDRGGALPIAEAARLLREIADALARAHRAGVVHRDIKPENILLDEGHALVMDFGIARAMTESSAATTLTQAGMAIGTPAYMAPEQVAADPHVDARADIYALGVVAYELLTGHPPFTGGTIHQVLAAQVTAIPDPVTAHRATVPPALADLVMRCLAKLPADRPQQASDLFATLDSAASTGGTSAPGVPKAVRAAWPRWLATAGIVGVLVAIGFLVTRRRQAEAGSSVRSADTIAVMRFRNVAGDTSHAHYGDGVSEEIMVGLTHVGPRLSVIGRTSSFSINLDSVEVPTAARKLGATVLLLGTMEWDGDSVRMTAELHDRTDHLIWAQSYDREAHSLSALENEISQAVVDSLRLHLASGQQTLVANATANTEAHRLYLQAKALVMKTDEASLRQAIVLLKQAVALDPNYAGAWAALATVYGQLADAYDAPLTVLPLIQDAARHAVAADSLNSDAQLAIGTVFTWDWDFPARRRELTRAVELDPQSADAHFELGEFLMGVDSDMAGARRELRQASMLDPLNPWTAWMESVAAGAAHDSVSDFALAERVLQLDPNFFYSIDPLASAYARWKRWPDCVARYQAILPALSNRPIGRYAECLAHAGRTDEARRVMRQLESSVGTSYVDATKIARIAVALNEPDTAFTWLERGYNERAGDLLFLTWDPGYTAIRQDPRFLALARRIGFPWALAHRPEASRHE